MWAYLARYPGLVVLHDPRLHHARARQLLSRRRFDDYRHEFWYDHPDARRDFVEYAVEGLGGPISTWSMLRVVMRTARLVAVHNPRVAADLRDEYPGARGRDDSSRPPGGSLPDPAARERVRAALGVPGRRSCSAPSGRSPPRSGSGRSSARSRRSCASRPTSISCWPATRRTTRRWPRRPRRRRSRARVHVTGYRPDEAWATTSRPPTPVCACAGRRRSKPRRRGCTASRRRGRRSSATSRTSSTSRPSIRAGGGRRGRRGSARSRSRSTCWTKTRRCCSRCAAGDGCATAGRARARRPRVLGGEPHARPDGRRLPPASRARRRAPRAGAGDLPAHFTGTTAAPRAHRVAVWARVDEDSGRYGSDGVQEDSRWSGSFTRGHSVTVVIHLSVPTRIQVRWSAACLRPACRW